MAPTLLFKPQKRERSVVVESLSQSGPSQGDELLGVSFFNTPQSCPKHLQELNERFPKTRNAKRTLMLDSHLAWVLSPLTPAEQNALLS